MKFDVALGLTAGGHEVVKWPLKKIPWGADESR
jgi:hypothetical protein